MTELLWFALVPLVGLLPAALPLSLGRRAQRERDQQRRTVALQFPEGLEMEPVVAFVRSLSAVPAGGTLSGSSSIVFELIARRGRLEHQLRLPRERADFVLAQLRAAIPAVGVEDTASERPVVTSAGQWRLLGSARALRTDQPASVAAAVLAALGAVSPRQSLTVQWVVVPSPPARPATTGPTTPSTDSPWLRLVAGPNRATAATAREQREKAAEPPFRAVLRIGATTGSNQRSAELISRLAGVLRVTERPGVRFHRQALSPKLVARRLVAATTPVVEFGCSVNARELATLVAWPIGSPKSPGLILGASRRLEPVPAVPHRGRVLGTSNLPGSTRPVALSAADSLHHTYVVGPTGVGKSTLLANLIVQDIAAGRSVVVLDPKGDLVTEVAGRIPAARRPDTIVLDPTDEDRPVGLNLLQGAAEAPELVTDAVVSIFHRLYAASWGPRTSDLLTSGLLTLSREPGMTLCELPTLFTSDAFRQRLVAGIDDPVLAGFWAWYEALSPGERAAALGPVMNKLRAFLLRRRLRNVIGQSEPTWSVADVLNRQQVLLVNLAKGQLGAEGAALVGSLVVALLWRAIQVRTLRLPAMVVIDEFQDVVNLPTDLGEVLAQARGFGVGLTLAHQHLGQLSAWMRQAVLANARTKVVFQTAIDDGGVLAKQLGGGLSADDLARLPAHQAYVAPCVSGEVRPPASILTLPLPTSEGTDQVVRRLSRETFGRERAAVEAAIAARQDLGGPRFEPQSERPRRRRRAQ